MAAGLDGSDKIVVSTRMLRAELLSVKADLERELEKVVLDCAVCGKRVTTSAVSACRPVIVRTRNPRLTRRRSSPADSAGPARRCIRTHRESGNRIHSRRGAHASPSPLGYRVRPFSVPQRNPGCQVDEIVVEIGPQVVARRRIRELHVRGLVDPAFDGRGQKPGPTSAPAAASQVNAGMNPDSAR